MENAQEEQELGDPLGEQQMEQMVNLTDKQQKVDLTNEQQMVVATDEHQMVDATTGSGAESKKFRAHFDYELTTVLINKYKDTRCSRTPYTQMLR